MATVSRRSPSLRRRSLRTLASGWVALSMLLGVVEAQAEDVPVAAAFQGVVRLDEAAVSGTEVFLLRADGTVAAATKTDAEGRFSLAPPTGFAGGHVLAKLFATVIGARAVAVPATPPSAPLAVTIRRAEARTLHVTLVPPDGVPFDWVDVLATPVRLDGVPPEARLALLATGTGPELRGAYWTARARRTDLAFAVLPGEWELRATRIVDAGLTVEPGPPNLVTASLEVDGRAVSPTKSGGYRFDVQKDCAVRVLLRRK